MPELIECWRKHMLTREEIQIDLLTKLNELCDKANVKYVLHDQAAFLAYNDEPIDSVASIEVLMCQGDAEKIADSLDDDLYYFEDFRSNPKFDRHMMFFGYKNSLDLKELDLHFDTDRHIENNCVRINIRFINHQVPKGTAKKLASQNDLWKFRHTRFTSNKFWRSKIRQKAINIVCFLMGNKRINRKRYENKKEHYAIDTWSNIKKYKFVKASGKKFKSSAFNEIVYKELNGAPAYILKDFDYYATRMYGNDWKNKTWGKVGKLNSSIISWEDFSNNSQVKKSLDEIQKLNESIYFDTLQLKEYQDSTKIIPEHVIQSADVVRTRENCIFQKENIIDSFSKRDFDELSKLLNPLIDCEKRAIGLGYSFSVDEDIDRILDEYLRENKRNKLANNIKKYMTHF